MKCLNGIDTTLGCFFWCREKKPACNHDHSMRPPDTIMVPSGNLT